MTTLLIVVAKFLIAIVSNMAKLFVIETLNFCHIMAFPFTMGIIGNKNNILNNVVNGHEEKEWKFDSVEQHTRLQIWDEAS